MNTFWKAALAIGGLAAIGAFVFWSLYKQWLSLPIFSQMSADQTFNIMIVFLLLTFGALIIFVFAYLYSKKDKGVSNSDYVFELHKSWEGVNEIDPERLIGPDVTRAARAMTITASSWLNNLVDKKVIIQNHFEDFELLYNAMVSCKHIVPGFEKRKTICKDFISEEMKKTYEEMKAYRKGA